MRCDNGTVSRNRLVGLATGVPCLSGETSLKLRNMHSCCCKTYNWRLRLVQYDSCNICIV